MLHNLNLPFAPLTPHISPSLSAVARLPERPVRALPPSYGPSYGAGVVPRVEAMRLAGFSVEVPDEPRSRFRSTSRRRFAGLGDADRFWTPGFIIAGLALTVVAFSKWSESSELREHARREELRARLRRGRSLRGLGARRRRRRRR